MFHNQGNVMHVINAKRFTRRKFLATSAMGLWLPTAFGASPIVTRRVVLSRTESAPDMLWQTTKIGVFNPTITKTGLPVEWNYGDGSARELTNAPSHTYAATGIKNVGIRLRDAKSLVTYIDMHSLGIIGPLFDFSLFVGLTSMWISTNTLTGKMPSFTPLLIVTGIAGSDNRISDYSQSIINLAFVTFVMNNNQLPQSAVDQIAADFATNIASRPATGTLNVGGTGNATPSATGLSNFNLVAAHGFTVTHN